ncbi:CHAT domain-containing protein [Stigmatella aurantiaca]|uniref:CHAT domain-containing protein n=1 Tax=Stigmatella aurantiaca TaxID=41 RepID=A0A1H8CJ10_STIAU|nr:CHAT domain-containing tetratricopeptide repeat protein [Stigmatella aurantiaca]SEM94889.1 CHAT domain-containing protein [Stigmatella aurantiaca]
MTVALLCCSAGAAAGEGTPADARLQESQTAYDGAKALQAAGKYAEAAVQAARALVLREALLGGQHPETASSLNLLGELHQVQGDFARAEPLLQRGLAIREAAFGKHHLSVAQSLNALATLYKVQGFYDRAAPLCERGLAIREAALGKNHLDVAQSLNTLANLFRAQGMYGRAEPLYVRAIAIREEILGGSHPATAALLNNLASLYFEQGMYGRAGPLYERALAVAEEALGKHHLTTGQFLNNLANVYKSQGLYSQAELLYARALAIMEETFGANHLNVAQALSNLASLFWEQGMYGRAEPLCQRALAVAEAALGKNHPEVAASLNILASIYREQGRYGRAESLFERSLAIQEKALGKGHPEVASSLNDLAVLKLAQRRVNAAVPLFARAFAISELRLRNEALDFSEARLASFLQYLRINEERLYSLVRAYPDNARVRDLALGAALLLKGRSAEETAGISRAVYRSLGPEEQGTFSRLRGLRNQLATLSLHGPGSLSPMAYQRRLQELAGQGNALEAELAKRSAPLRALAALPPLSRITGHVAAALPQEGALIEFIAYEDRPLVPKSGMSVSQQDHPLRYLALVLLPDATIRVCDLGPAGPIDAAAARLRDALASRDADFQPHAQALYQLVFQPLLPLLGKAHRLFLSPDGQLGLVPFAALHDGHRFLVDAFDFTAVTSGKDLLPRPQKTAPATSIVVLADPDFSAAPSAQPFSVAGASAQPERPGARGVALGPLPGTRQEAEAIQRLLPQAKLFLGPEATKERLLHLPAAPGILHLATHGFFLEDVSGPSQSRAVGHFGALGEDVFAESPSDPLLRSGLFFAGASAPVSGASSGMPSPLDSSLVTALELAGLNLWGTQLVVLSACDTGRGDVRLGQGVYGLRRAFIVAGAETVVMSLWKVNDDSTQQLMEAYYRNLLAGRGRATAMREAMRGLRATQPHPYHWAPFIVLGRDAPLRGWEPRPLEPSLTSPSARRR